MSAGKPASRGSAGYRRDPTTGGCSSGKAPHTREEEAMNHWRQHMIAALSEATTPEELSQAAFHVGAGSVMFREGVDALGRTGPEPARPPQQAAAESFPPAAPAQRFPPWATGIMATTTKGYRIPRPPTVPQLRPEGGYMTHGRRNTVPLPEAKEFPTEFVQCQRCGYRLPAGEPICTLCNSATGQVPIEQMGAVFSAFPVPAPSPSEHGSEKEDEWGGVWASRREAPAERARPVASSSGFELSMPPAVGRVLPPKPPEPPRRAATVRPLEFSAESAPKTPPLPVRKKGRRGEALSATDMDNGGR